MDLENKLIDLLNQSQQIKTEQLCEITAAPKDIAVSAICACLNYPNLNALLAAYNVPDARYEKKLLSYAPADMQDHHAIYWMLTLGKMHSKTAFDKIKHYTKTSLFHQAFISMAEIDLARTMVIFEDFLDKHCNRYDTSNTTFWHDSGFNTLVLLLELYPSARDLIKKYDLSKHEKKKKLVQDALNYKE
ncbi:MAG: hypothetical protein QW666_01190 [Candidatus Woesearchaeota archaeon]